MTGSTATSAEPRPSMPFIVGATLAHGPERFCFDHEDRLRHGHDARPDLARTRYAGARRVGAPA